MCIAVIYCKTGQTNPHDMFKNQPSEKFNQFLVDMGIHPEDKKQNSMITWKHMTIKVFVATQLNADEHRRDVGNAPALIFFNEGEEFDTSDIDKMGMVPQIFIVVQPGPSREDGYRLGFFRSGNMHPFGPPVPPGYLYSQDIKDYIYTKIHNGNVMFFYSSPLNRAFMQRRQMEIDQIVEKYK